MRLGVFLLALRGSSPWSTTTVKVFGTQVVTEQV